MEEIKIRISGKYADDYKLATLEWMRDIMPGLLADYLLEEKGLYLEEEDIEVTDNIVKINT